MKKIDGKEIAAKKLLALKERVESMSSEPALGVILVGDDAPSHLYVKLKEKAAKEVGVELRKYVFDKDVSKEELRASIEFLNLDQDTHGIIVQLPLPSQFSAEEIVSLIDPEKDVDGFHSINQERFLQRKDFVYPVFPRAIVELIESCNVILPEKKAVVVGKSDVFDRVMTHALELKGLETQFIHCANKKELSQKEKEIINQSDVIVTACGVPGIVSCDIVQDGSIVIDGGISKVDGKTVGDADLSNCGDRDIFVSPVPGGVGPMTIAYLLENVVELSKKQL